MEGRRGAGREEVRRVDECEGTNLVVFAGSNRSGRGLVEVVAAEMEQDGRFGACIRREN